MKKLKMLCMFASLSAALIAHDSNDNVPHDPSLEQALTKNGISRQQAAAATLENLQQNVTDTSFDRIDSEVNGDFNGFDSSDTHQLHKNIKEFAVNSKNAVTSTAIRLKEMTKSAFDNLNKSIQGRISVTTEEAAPVAVVKKVSDNLTGADTAKVEEITQPVAVEENVTSADLEKVAAVVEQMSNDLTGDDKDKLAKAVRSQAAALKDQEEIERLVIVKNRNLFFGNKAIFDLTSEAAKLEIVKSKMSPEALNAINNDLNLSKADKTAALLAEYDKLYPVILTPMQTTTGITLFVASIGAFIAYKYFYPSKNDNDSDDEKNDKN